MCRREPGAEAALSCLAGMFCAARECAGEGVFSHRVEDGGFVCGREPGAEARLPAWRGCFAPPGSGRGRRVFASCGGGGIVCGREPGEQRRRFPAWRGCFAPPVSGRGEACFRCARGWESADGLPSLVGRGGDVFLPVRGRCCREACDVLVAGQGVLAGKKSLGMVAKFELASGGGNRYAHA